MQSRQQLIYRALRELRVLAAGQAPAAEDYSAANAEVVPLMADLATRGIFTWGDPDQIDDAAAIHLGVLLANSIAPQFGLPQDDAKRIRAETRLLQLGPYELSGQPQRAEYF